MKRRHQLPEWLAVVYLAVILAAASYLLWLFVDSLTSRR